ncbi:5-(carboxyamino)imidazole ribonucleotide synthase [Brackiella oedipodis]|uniref:5-(carboxyamino)imidazole ribonucleotide synthase n=1 Tax=Brackiella oedipodis TaxID=124225 RepID=UPI000A0598F9|nr:5-(carboxyamino)imidazole ribonucleotide synthase [Brackiella oedipodis]
MSVSAVATTQTSHSTSSLPPTPTDVFLPPQCLGMMGDGQLGRMFCQAAQAMGYKVAVLGTEKDGPAAQIAQYFIHADYDQTSALQQLAQLAPVITTEFENVPAQSLKTLSMSNRVAPCAAAVAVVQDRMSEKAFVNALDIPVAPYAEIHSVQEIESVSESLFPAILKTARMGYDGKGQARVANATELLKAFKDNHEVPCVLEKMLALKQEVSVVLARAHDGQIAHYPIAVNHHIDGILSSTYVAEDNVDSQLQTQAYEYASRIAEQLNYVGVLCVEFFVYGQNQLVVNEIAPRPHNSGHYTLNACACSQFEQQVRALTGLPLGSTRLLAPAIMLNVLGDSWWQADGRYGEPAWQEVLAIPGVSLHLYGKDKAHRGRKMAHINIVHPDLKVLKQNAQAVSDILHLGAQIPA